MPASASAASTRSAPRCATPSSTARTISARPRAAGEAEQRAARAVVPLRRAEAEQRGHVHDAAGVGALRGDLVRLGGARDEAEVVAQPLHVGAGREHDRLDAPRDPPVARARRRSGTCRPGPRVEARAALAPRTTSSMPPVPNVILASPGRTQPCPTSDACWSPSERRDRRRARQRRRVADDAARVDDRRAASRAGCRAASSVRASQADGASRDLQAGDRGVRRVGDVDRRRPTASTRSTCRRCRSTGHAPRPRSGSWSSSHCSLVADWFGPTRRPSPAARGTRRPCAGPASRCPGRRVRRSPGPTRPSSRAGSRCRRRRRARRLQRGRPRGRGTMSAIARRVELDEPVGRRVGSSSLVVASVASVSNTARSARADVDDEHALAYAARA